MFRLQTKETKNASILNETELTFKTVVKHPQTTQKIDKKAKKALQRNLEQRTDYKAVHMPVIAAPTDLNGNEEINIDNLMNDYGKIIEKAKKGFPIIIDRLYPLEHASHAIDYVLNNDKSLLGENVGILINKEENFKCLNQNNAWYPIQLDNIENYYEEKEMKAKLRNEIPLYEPTTNELESNQETETKLNVDESEPQTAKQKLNKL